MSATQDFALPAYGWMPRVQQMPAWRAAMDDKFRKGMLVWHRRYGKDEIGLQVTCVKAMRRVGSYAYMLPEYAQARRAIWEQVNWRTKRTRIDDAFPPEIVAKKDNQSMMLWLTSGSTVQLLGSDSFNSIVGTGYAGLVLSEAALSNPQAIDFFRPMLLESGGWELQISTPRGKNAFYKDFLGTLDDMRQGVPGRFAELVRASESGIFSQAELLQVRLDLIRKHGHTIGQALYDQEYECSFDAAVVGAVWGKELQELELQQRVFNTGIERRLPVHTSWDLGVGDATVILFWQDIRGENVLVDAFEANDIGLDTYIEVLKHKKQQHRWHYGEHIGPHDIQQREWSRGLSRRDEAARHGLHFKRAPNTRVKTQIACGAALIRNMVVNSGSEGAMAALARFKGYRFPTNKATGELVPTPLHDENSHASSALMTYGLWNAAALGVGDHWKDEELHGDDLGGTKFDPRMYDTKGAFRGGGGVPHPQARAYGAFG